MKRRSLLVTASLTALAGCTQQEGGEESATRESWPTAKDSSPENARRDYDGGAQDASLDASKMHFAGGYLSVSSADATTQLGVFTGTTDRENSESIPKERFEWYEPEGEGYLWVVYFEVGADDGEIEMPSPDKWRARPTINYSDDEGGFKNFTALYDPQPVYYRIPMIGGGTNTVPAYLNQDEDGIDYRAMVFDVNTTAIDLNYGIPPEHTWYFGI
jgi:hypothetical protein